MNEQTVVNQFMNTVLEAINSGHGFIQNDIWWLFQVLLVINLTLSGLYWALGSDEVIVGLMKRVLLIGFLVFLLDSWPYLTDTLGKTFVQLGLKAGGDGVTPGAFLDPGRVAGLGYLVTNHLWDAARDLVGPKGLFTNFVEIMVLLFTGVVVLVAFFVFATQILLAVIAYKLGALVVFVLVPFAVLNKTAFLAERPLGYLFAMAVRLMVMAFVVSVAFRLFTELSVGNPDEMTIRTAVALAFGAVLVLTLAFLAPRIATDVVAGTPSLGLGDLMAPAAVTGGLVYGAARAGMLASQLGGPLARGGLAAVRAATNAVRDWPASSQASPTTISTGSLIPERPDTSKLGGGNRPFQIGGRSPKLLEYKPWLEAPPSPKGLEHKPRPKRIEWKPQL